MNPDYHLAAVKAAETLITYGISSAPVDPLPILKKLPGVLVLTYEDLSKLANVNRDNVLDLVGCNNQDAITTAFIDEPSPLYVVAYNKMLPSVLVDRALARELGHIVLGHDGTKPESIRNEEAACFAKHLLFPRPLLHMITASGIRLTTAVLNNLTGCNDHCISCLRRLPAISVPAELNRQVRDNFMPYFMNYFHYQQHAAKDDTSALADLCSYMDGYEE